MTYLYICISMFCVLRILAYLYNPNRTWTIKKGNHYVSLWQRIMFLNWWIMTWKVNTYRMEYCVQWDSSALYFIGKDQSDWNKAPGLQERFNKNVRSLNGWRCVPTRDDIETTGYRHVGSSKPEYDSNGLTARRSFFHYLQNLEVKAEYRFPVFPLFVYFGGTRTAPHDITIRIDYLTINGREV